MRQRRVPSFPRPLSVLLLVAASFAACGGGDDDKAAPGVGGATAGYKTCSLETRTGEFVLERAETFTGVQSGYVLDGVEPLRIPVEVSRSGGCRIMQPPKAAAPCAPDCPVGQMCSKGKCAKQPAPQPLGKVTLGGLKAPITLKATDNRYTNDGPLPHPAYEDGEAITLTASGEAGYGPFTLKGTGVGELKLPKEPLLVEEGKPVTLTWPAPAKPGGTRILVNFAVNLHGTTDTWLECEVADTGSFTVDGATTKALFMHGVSGFPRVSITRQSADTTMVRSGCAEFRVKTEADRDLKVPGLTSCQGDSDCPAGKACQGDLTCSK
jgi:hypothetical protein